jgi:hypothetical protein
VLGGGKRQAGLGVPKRPGAVFFVAASGWTLQASLKKRSVLPI